MPFYRPWKFFDMPKVNFAKKVVRESFVLDEFLTSIVHNMDAYFVQTINRGSKGDAASPAKVCSVVAYFCTRDRRVDLV